MAIYDEEFLEQYLQVAYKLQISDILDQLSNSDLIKFGDLLCQNGILHQTEARRAKEASNEKGRKSVLLKALISKDVYWLTPGEVNVLTVLAKISSRAADYTVVVVLQAFNDILDKVLVSQTSRQTPSAVTAWGKRAALVCDDTELDGHLRKLGYILSLPQVLAHVTDLRTFIRQLRENQLISPTEVDSFFPTNLQKLSCFLAEKDEEAVFACLGSQKVLAEKMKQRAYSYVSNAVLDPPPEPTNVKKWGLLLLGAVGVGAATVVAAPLALAAVGFGTGGIAAGSLAAAFMSTYGGAVSAGSLCALLQSAGAAGLAASTSAGIGAASTTASFGLFASIAAAIKKFRAKRRRKYFDY